MFCGGFRENLAPSETDTFALETYCCHQSIQWEEIPTHVTPPLKSTFTGTSGETRPAFLPQLSQRQAGQHQHDVPRAVTRSQGEGMATVYESVTAGP